MAVTSETVTKLCHQGHVNEAVEALGVLVETDSCVSRSLFYAVVKECVVKKNVVLGRRVHAFTVTKGYGADTFLCNHILRMYASHGRLQEAMDVFTVVAEPDAFMWSSIISAHVKHGRDKEALQLYRLMRGSSVKPDGHVFVAALQACARVADLRTGQDLHADVLASGVEPDVFVCSCLVHMYAKCGSLDDAQRVFDGLGEKNVVTWTALIAGYSQQGMGQQALALYRVMQAEGIDVPNSVTFVCLLQACATVGTPALELGKQLHAELRERGHLSDVIVANSLVNMYAKCGSLKDAQGLFDGLHKKDVATWNAMMAGYSQQGMGQETLCLYRAMQEECMVAPDPVTFVCLLQACASLGTPALEIGKEIHAQVRERGFEADGFVTSSLVNMYAKCGSLEVAQRLFDGLGQKNVVTWNALLAGYSQRGMGKEALHLYRAMREEGMAVPDSVTFACVLQACARCGNLEEARTVFNGLSRKDVVMWNAMIAGYSQQGMGRDALLIYNAMQAEGQAVPDSMTFVFLLQACAGIGTPGLEMGKELHAQIKGYGHQADGFVASSLVNMYAKCGSLEDAQRVFDGLGRKDVVTWNAMLGGYSQQGLGQEALCLYNAMEKEGMTVPDSVTFVSLLQACASVGTAALEKGRQLHAQIRERGHEADAFVGTSLVNMYAKCGRLEDAQRVFGILSHKDVVTWTAMIAGYSQQGMGQEALRLYTAMQKECCAVPDSMTFVCLLQACANVAALHVGRQLHAQIKEQGLQGDVYVAASLINMYGKSGSLLDAQEVFDAMSHRDVASWSALIAGYACQGDSQSVFNLVQRMEEVGIQPDSITFLSVLTVCSHANLVDKGRECFEAMSKHYSIPPTLEHYTCMLDLLGRAGRLDEALALVSTVPLLPNAAVWHTLLGACQKWRNVDVGRQAFDQAVKLDKKDAAAYVLMSNIYTGVQMWDQAQEMQARRKDFRAWKQPGQSWWTDMDGLVHSFLVGDDKASPESGKAKVVNKMTKGAKLALH